MNIPSPEQHKAALDAAMDARPRWMNTRFGGSDNSPEKRDADLVAMVDALAERVAKLEAKNAASESAVPVSDLAQVTKERDQLFAGLELVGCPPGFRVLNDGPGREVLVHDDEDECPVFETKVQAVLFAWANYEPDEA
jgi:hypothetical protein